MNTFQFLERMKAKGVSLWVDEGVLRYRAPKGALGAEDKQQLTARKKEITSFLAEASEVVSDRAGEIPKVPSGQRLPLSFAQQRLWFLHQMDPDSSVYHMPLVMHLTGQLDPVALNRVLETLVQRHAVLRTGFPKGATGPYQRVSEPGDLHLPVIDLGRLSKKMREQVSNRLATIAIERPFNMERGPLFRVSLCRLTAHNHILFFNIHHMVSDGRSMRVLFHEFTVLYEAFSQASTSPLTPLPIQYGDFSLWQRKRLGEDGLAAQTEYWKTNLSGAPPRLALPTDFPRPKTLSSSGKRLEFPIPEELTQPIQQLCREQNLTLFMAFLGSFAAFLSRLTAQSDLCIGIPIQNRNHPQVQGLIGFFVNTLILRIDCSMHPSYFSLLDHVRTRILDAFDHQDLPFEQVVELVQPERETNRVPLVQSLFSFEETGPDPEHNAVSVKGLTLNLHEYDRQTAKFDLSLHILKNDRDFHGSLNYNTDLFRTETITRFRDYFLEILKGLNTEPHQPVSRHDLFSYEERNRIMNHWGKSGDPKANNHWVHEQFEERAAIAPHRTALQFEEETFSFGYLNKRANRLARSLKERGVGPSRGVGLYTSHSGDLLTGILATWKAGGYYVPLDPTLPSGRLASIAKEGGLVGILSTEEADPNSWLNKLEGIPQWTLKFLQPLSRDINYSNPRLHADDPAYLIFTSGSTGRPKGVLVPHRGLPWMTKAQEAHFEVGPTDRIHQTAAIGFDASVFEICMALTKGATLVGSRRHPRLLGGDLAYWLAQRSISVITITPSALASLPPNPLPRLRILVVAGEAPFAGQLVPWSVHHRVFNAYGPTEATVWSTVAECNSNEQLPALGHPIDGTQAMVLDKDLHCVPPCLRGELFLAGPGLAQGYKGQPALTAERFVPNPYAEIPGQRMYGSGDYATQLPDGRLAFQGRNDRQTKLRGFRAELAEIESLLTIHPLVSQAVVMQRVGSEGPTDLMAYVVPREKTRGPDLEKALRQNLTRHLPEPMVPRYFMTLEQLPLTANGKLDLSALPMPKPVFANTENQQWSTSNPVEEVLQRIWSEVLGVTNIGSDDHFFALGGHSLTAAQVQARVHDTFQTNLSLQVIFENPRLKDMAKKIQIGMQLHEEGNEPPLTRVSRVGTLPLSFAQERLWFLDQLEPESPAYNLPLTFSLTGEFSKSCLEKAFQELAFRHEILRTRFPSQDGQASQMIETSPTFDMTMVDRSGLAGDPSGDVWKKDITTHAMKPFSLASGPLIHITIFSNSETQHILYLNLHHIISDGWSMKIFFKELNHIYQKLIRGETPALAELPLQYADFAHWQRQWLQGQILETQLRFWEAYLADAPDMLQLPCDYPRPSLQTYEGGRHRFEIDASVTSRLVADARQRGTTLFMTLVTAYAVLLQKYCDQNDICIGTPVANRNRTAIEGLIGFFVNMVVIRIRPEPQLSFAKLLDQAWQRSLRAYAHQDLPFEKVVDRLARDRDLSRTPVFQTMFCLGSIDIENQDRDEDAVGLKLKSVNLKHPTAKYDLSLDMNRNGEKLTATLEYKSALFHPQTIERMARHLQNLLEQFARNPDLPLQNASPLSSEERSRLLDQWGRFDMPLDTLRCVHQLFETQANRTPQAPALLFGNRTLSYDQLNERANHLAGPATTTWHRTRLPSGALFRNRTGSSSGHFGHIKSRWRLPAHSTNLPGLADYLFNGKGSS